MIHFWCAIVLLKLFRKTMLCQKKFIIYRLMIDTDFGLNALILQLKIMNQFPIGKGRGLNLCK
ncbi:hypothetical protein P608_23420 [Comamonas thiooxydans]|uniref:Uncharacterized protein n=1 Tax=Comamonas thiooxydans TaxID=363952 RepID=A0A0E3BP23_9BURK|nr:hypothetical protein P608_23420 [Comamonas thiooxydans]KGH10317.1 hypothetical protein P607_26525 [Comamonas thiooxydans]KGH18560.1 hypothetical protein P606_24850 [Comamonas thiooxydans]